jgi:hypothetical protein
LSLRVVFRKALVSEVGFIRTSMIHWNMVKVWFQKRKDKESEDSKSLIPEWLLGHPQYGNAAALWSVTGGKNYQWRLGIVTHACHPSYSRWGVHHGSRPSRGKRYQDSISINSCMVICACHSGHTGNVNRRI